MAGPRFQPSHEEKVRPPMMIKANMRMRLTMTGTMTKSVGMYLSFPTSS